MRIHSVNNQNLFTSNFQSQNTQLKSIVNNLNAKAQQGRRNFDVVEISQRLKQLKEPATKSGEKTIDHRSSPLNGARTEAQWAESSLTQQRNGVNSISNVLQYQKERLGNIVSKIEQYEKIAGGDSTQKSGSIISPERAMELAERYKEAIKTDFSKEIEDTISFYNSWVKAYDVSSGGLASAVMGNLLKDISAESLGLNHLPDSPSEIMKAIDGATEKLQKIVKTIEERYSEASGKKMVDADAPNTEMWKSRIELENLFLESVTIDANVARTGQPLKMMYSRST